MLCLWRAAGTLQGNWQYLVDTQDAVWVAQSCLWKEREPPKGWWHDEKGGWKTAIRILTAIVNKPALPLHDVEKLDVIDTP